MAAGKVEAAEPSWRRPLSRLISRHKKAPEVPEEKGSVFRFKRQKNASSTTDSTLDFKPLEVNIDLLEGMHLSDDWSEMRSQEPQLETDRERKQRQRQSVATVDSVTPIADLFASKSLLDVPASGELCRSCSHNHGSDSKRPFSMLEAGSTTYLGVVSDGAAPACSESLAVGSILERGRPVEARHFAGDPLRKAKAIRQELPPLPQIGYSASSSADRTSALENTPQILYPARSSSSSSVTGRFNAPTSQLLAPKAPETVKRHSMYEVGTTSLKPVAPKPKPTAETPRSASAMPLDRIKAWQRSITSAPSTTPTSAPKSLVGPTGVPASGALQTRRASGRSAMGDRLAWIRELEEKKSSGVNRDLPVLKKQAGSVSDKLAMFESKQSSSPGPRLPPLSRSNSTTSRFSSVGVDSTSSAFGNTIVATPRTSIDTVRSSHRASSVMSYYDDTFREKMESVVGGLAPEKDKAEVPAEKLQPLAPAITVEPAQFVAEPEDASDAPEDSTKATEPTALADETAPEAAPKVAEVASEATDAAPKTADVAAEAEPVTEATEVVAETKPVEAVTEIAEVAVEGETTEAVTEAAESIPTAPEQAPKATEAVAESAEASSAAAETTAVETSAKATEPATETTHADVEATETNAKAMGAVVEVREIGGVSV
ncbi:hypothetical protein BX600DRAFT_100428 [Xylariales sp. PMI_506]|nr:hypothetical protein BX600DRAFT_100428 [Xylariales sp. PMI_506]